MSAAELGMRIAVWAGSKLPMPEEIAAHFPMSRATAYRYHDYLRAAKGLPPLEGRYGQKVWRVG